MIGGRRTFAVWRFLHVFAFSLCQRPASKPGLLQQHARGAAGRLGWRAGGRDDDDCRWKGFEKGKGALRLPRAVKRALLFARGRFGAHAFCGVAACHQ